MACLALGLLEVVAVKAMRENVLFQNRGGNLNELGLPSVSNSCGALAKRDQKRAQKMLRCG